MLRRNFRYKLLALAVALVIWGYANLGQNPNVTRELMVTLEARNVKDGYVVTNAPQQVRVTLQGQRSHIEAIVAEPDNVAAYVKVGDRAPGRYVLPVKVDIPLGLKGLVRASASPSDVAISLDEKAQRTFQVDVQFVSPPPVGYRFGAPELSPARAIVTGTTEQVGSVSQLVATVDSKEAVGGVVDADIAPTPQDKGGNTVSGIEVNPSRVHVHLQLLDAPASRIVFVSPDIVGQPQFPSKVSRIDVAPQTIAVTGRPDQLAGVTTLRTQPVSVAGHSATFTQRVRVITPQGLAIGDNRYVRVTVEISTAPEQKSPTSTADKGN